MLRSFFQEQSKEVPAFKYFCNSLLFEHIVQHKFKPGAGYDTCHHGISLLAVSLHSQAAQEQEHAKDKHFDRATTKTPNAIRKHTSAKAPPALPPTIGEFLQQLWRLVVLTTGLFTTHCSLAIQLRDLHSALQEREHILMGDPDAIRELIPQLVWVVTAASREFYGTITMRDDINPPTEHIARTVAVANLSLHTTMFKAGIWLNLTNVPTQWKTTKNGGTQSAPSNSGDKAAGQSKKRHGSDPFRSTDAMDQPAQGPNPNHPKAFKESDLLKKVRDRFGRKTSLVARRWRDSAACMNSPPQDSTRRHVSPGYAWETALDEDASCSTPPPSMMRRHWPCSQNWNLDYIRLWQHQRTNDRIGTAAGTCTTCVQGTYWPTPLPMASQRRHSLGLPRPHRGLTDQMASPPA